MDAKAVQLRESPRSIQRYLIYFGVIAGLYHAIGFGSGGPAVTSVIGLIVAVATLYAAITLREQLPKGATLATALLSLGLCNQLAGLGIAIVSRRSDPAAFGGSMIGLVLATYLLANVRSLVARASRRAD